MCKSEVGSRRVRIVVDGETGHLVSNRRRLICLIARGEEVEILPSHLTQVSGGRGYTTGYKRCRQCGYETTEDFDFCPKCGTRF